MEPAVAAVHLLRKLLPDTEGRIAEELVWLRLVLDARTVDDALDRDGLVLRDRFRVAEGAWDGKPTEHERAVGPDPLAHHLHEREAATTALVARALVLLGSPDSERRADELELRALLAGLGVEVCLGRLAPADAVAVLDRAVRRRTPG